MRQLLPLALALTLIGCTTTKIDVRNEAEAARFDPATTARVRVISGDNVQGNFVSGQSCEKFFNDSVKRLPIEQSGWKDVHVDSPGLFPFRYSDKQNSVIGMPASKVSKTINNSPRLYDEYVVAANQPFIVLLGMAGSISCSPKPMTFIPEPGQNYEVQFQFIKLSTFTSGCTIELRKLEVVGNNTTETDIQPQVCFRSEDGLFHTMDALSKRQ